MKLIQHEIYSKNERDLETIYYLKYPENTPKEKVDIWQQHILEMIIQERENEIDSYCRKNNITVPYLMISS